ncbi:MAG: hypothetical protein ABIW46_03150, partial [Acidimicrobiales bacterium]
EGFAGMGSTIGSRAITLGGMSGAMAIEDGADRAMLDGEFGKRVEAKLAELYDRTWTLLEANRREVLAVAHALEAHKTVSGDDVAAIIDGVRGPLVDGQPYVEAEFLTVAEEYHEKAVAAHQGHSRVELPLPVWANGHRAGEREYEPVIETPRTEE